MSHRAEQLLVWSVCCWASQSSVIDVRADAEVIVEDGAAGILNFTFTSNQVVSSFTDVIWSFRSNQPDHKFSKDDHLILLFRNGVFSHAQSEFEDRLRFIGDIYKRDVSIQLSPVQLGDSGSYTCGVRNPPDLFGPLAQTELRVVRRDEPSKNPPPTGESPTNPVLISVCVVIIIIISATVLTIYCKRCSREDGATGGGGGGGGEGAPNSEGEYENTRPESEKIYQDLRLEDMEPTYSDLHRR